MSDLGSDAGSTSLNLTAKVLEAILQLFSKIYEAHMKAPERKLAQYKVKNAKTEDERRKAIEKVDSKTGYINHKLLKKTGEPLCANLFNLSKDEMKQFGEICKREGVVFSAVSNVHLKQDGEKAFFAIECRQSDLEHIRKCVDRLNDEKRIAEIDKRIAEIVGKGEDNLTERDYAALKAYNEQRAEIQRAYAITLNRDMSETVLHNATSPGLPKEVMTISEALNRITGRSIDKDQYSIIADAHDPSKIIRCHGYEDKDPTTGSPYIKTDYEVYHGNECVMKTNDGRFEGRQPGFWTAEKERIQEAAAFSGEYFKFQTEQEYRTWAEYVNEQNRGELSEMEKAPETKDYASCRQAAYKKLEENGAEIRDGVACDKQSGKPVAEVINDPSITPEQRAAAAESSVVARQLENYDTIERLRNHADYVNSQLILATPGSPEYLKASEDRDKTKEQIAEAYKKDMELVEERKSINAVQSVQQTEQEHGKTQEEHQDGRRAERVDEHDERQMTLEEAKGEIEERKAEGAKGADHTDRQVAEHGKTKQPKSKPDRAD